MKIKQFNQVKTMSENDMIAQNLVYILLPNKRDNRSLKRPKLYVKIDFIFVKSTLKKNTYKIT